MKNTLALAIIILGGMLVYGGYKDFSFADTIRFFTGQKLQSSGPVTRGFKDGTPQDIQPKAPTKPSAFHPTTPTNSPSAGHTGLGNT